MNSPKWFKYAALAGALTATSCNKQNEEDNLEQTQTPVSDLQGHREYEQIEADKIAKLKANEVVTTASNDIKQLVLASEVKAEFLKKRARTPLDIIKAVEKGNKQYQETPITTDPIFNPFHNYFNPFYFQVADREKHEKENESDEEKNERLSNYNKLYEQRLHALEKQLFGLFDEMRMPFAFYQNLLVHKGGKRISIRHDNIEDGGHSRFAHITIGGKLRHWSDPVTPDNSECKEYIAQLEQYIQILTNLKVQKKYMVVSSKPEVLKNLGVNVRNDFLGKGSPARTLLPNTLVEVIFTDPETGYSLIRWIDDDSGRSFESGFVQSSLLKPYRKDEFNYADSVIKKVKPRGDKEIELKTSDGKAIIVPANQEMNVLALYNEEERTTKALVQYMDSKGKLVVGYITVKEAVGPAYYGKQQPVERFVTFVK